MLLSKCIAFMKETASAFLNFVPLVLNNSKLVLFSDASFSNTHGLRSQLEFVLILTEAAGICNILHYERNHCQRMVRSVLAAEVHGLVLGFNYSVILQHLISQLLGKNNKS